MSGWCGLSFSPTNRSEAKKEETVGLFGIPVLWSHCLAWLEWIVSETGQGNRTPEPFT